MFKRGKSQQFEITEHPAVIAALNAMWQQAYDAGRRDALAIVEDFRDETDERRVATPTFVAFLEGIDAVVERLGQQASG